MNQKSFLTLAAVVGLGYLFFKNQNGGGVQTNPSPSGAEIKAPTISLKIVG